MNELEGILNRNATPDSTAPLAAIVAEVDPEASEQALETVTARVQALETQLSMLTARVEALEKKPTPHVAKTVHVTASANQGAAERKTVSGGVAHLLAKAGLAQHGTEEGAIAAGSSVAKIDAALASLPIEQRIAVKSELLRSGLV